MGLFGKSPDKNPKDMIQEWTSKIRREGYGLERQIKAIQREEEKTKRSIKEYAKKGETGACKILAKEVIKSRKAVNKLYASKAHMNSISMSMKNQLATLRVAGSLQKSTEVLKSMQALVKVPEIQATMRDLSKEMMKAGIIEEMLDDTMDDVLGSEDLDEEADEEVDKILLELTAGELGKAPAAVKDSLPVQEEEGATAALPELDDDDDEMRQRLEALRS